MLYEYCVLLIFPFALIYAGISDAMSFTISNKISLGLFVGFILLVPFSGLTLAEIGFHVAVGFLMLIVGFVLFARGYFGGGDAKIIAATSLWLGPEYTGMFLLFVAIYGGLLSLVILKVHKTPLPSFLANQRWLVNYQTGTAAVPYGIAIGLSGLSIYPYSHWLGLF
ncbi:prepilin peptidase [Hyphomicrobiales bacterium 4NK60-0047b]|jgi:prepilin peptidase CpaA